MNFIKKYDITEDHLTKPSKRRPGSSMQLPIKFIVAHDTGNRGSTARGNVKYYENSRNDMFASAHLFVDDKEIIECIPALLSTPEKAYHVRANVEQDNILFGSNANESAIGIEYCYGGTIKAEEAYRRYLWVIAYTIHKFNLKPNGSVVGHFFLDPTRKTDPVTGLAHSRRTYEQLLRDIEEEYLDCTGGLQPVPTENHDRRGTVITTAKLNIRKGLPSTRAVIVTFAPIGTQLEYVDWTDDGEVINGISRWYKTQEGNYFWGGGVM
ncbi:MAG: N-acetylmuramoyl-L-alanine amidase [Ignavibacteriales bacterium]|nr:N-acetylmuramoyl-L-alanine amidase [Ignavibacteriales bacterium]